MLAGHHVLPSIPGFAERTAHEIRETVKKETTLTVSVGVSWNKIFAKMGSDYKKPDAVTVIDRDNYRRIVWPLPPPTSCASAGPLEKALALSGQGFSVVDHYHKLDTRFAKSYTLCPFLQFLTVIGADCRVYSCQDKAYTNSGLLGSIRNRSFKEFWFSEENRQKLFSLNPSVHCHHHCVAHHKNLNILDFLSLAPGHSAFV